jgi:ribosomal protein S24E
MKLIMEIIHEKKNPFMERTELMIEIEHEGKATPSRAEIQKMVAGEIKKREDNIEIKNIFSEHGMAKSKVKVFAWDKKKVMLKKKKNKKTKENKAEHASENKEEVAGEQTKDEKTTKETKPVEEKGQEEPKLAPEKKGE